MKPIKTYVDNFFYGPKGALRFGLIIVVVVFGIALVVTLLVNI